MVEHLELEEQVKKEERILGRIARIQQAADGLDIGPEDLSQRNLSQARTTIRYLRATSYIGRIHKRLGPISAEIDRQALVFAEDHQRQLQGKVRDLRVVETARGSPFTGRDIMPLRQEVLDFRQRPLEDSLLARGIKIYNQRVTRKPEGPTPDGHESPLDAKRRELLGRVVLEESGRHVLIDGVRIVFTSLVSQAAARRMHEDLLTPWGDSLGVHRDDIARIAQEHGYKGKQPGYDPIRTLNDAFRYNNLGIRIGSTPDPHNRRYVYYRFTMVEPAIPKVDIPKFRPEAYTFPKKPFPPTPSRDYLESLREVMASFTKIDEDTKLLLNQFLASPAASYAILNAMVEFNTRPSGEQETKEFYRFLAGDFLAELGNVQLQPKYQKMGQTLLSPYEKFILLRNAHQERDIVDPSGYGTSFEIAGVPSPDGLVLCETDQALEVVAIVEYKNVTSRNEPIMQRIREQHALFTPAGLERQLRLTDPDQPIDPLFLGELIHDKLRPDLSPKPLVVNPQMRVVYAVPEGASLPIENVEPEYVHISSGEIGLFLELLTRALKK